MESVDPEDPTARGLDERSAPWFWGSPVRIRRIKRRATALVQARAITMARVADVLVDSLAAGGVREVFGVAGDSLNAVTDSLRPRKDVRWVHVRNE